MLDEQQELEQRGVLVMRMAEAANHRRDLAARGRLAVGQALQRRREVHIVPLEGFPHQFVFAFEVPVQRAL